jgi:hypothetical protein
MKIGYLLITSSRGMRAESGYWNRDRKQQKNRLPSRLSVKRGIVEQVVDDVKTEGSAKTFTLAGDLLARLKSWKQLTAISHDMVQARWKPAELRAERDFPARVW